jgi:hypothetical protein
MIDNVPVGFLGYAIDFHRIGLVDSVEKRWKGIAEIETATTPMADIEDPFELIEQRGLVVKLVGTPVKCVPCRRLETALAFIA